MKLSKRQVKGLVDIMKSTVRSEFKQLNIQEGYLYVTDSYSMVRIKLAEDVPNGIVLFKDVDVWYKLATVRDYMTEDFIIEHLDTEGVMPNNLSRVFGDMHEAFSLEKEAYTLDFNLVDRVVRSVSHDKEVNAIGGKSRIYVSNRDDSGIEGIVLGMRSNFTLEYNTKGSY